MDTEPAVIRVENVSKKFRLPQEKHGTIKAAFTNMFRHRNRNKHTRYALRDINFEIKKGEFFGIVGRNGSGKSTLLKMLAGIYQPTIGSVTVTGKLVPFIELGVGFNPELTGRENVYLNGALLGFSKKEIDGMYDNIVEFAELEKFMDQKLKNYSSGMQVRLAFSMAVRAQADILLIDEVLAVGDADFQRKCFAYFKELKAQKKTVVFVTHDMGAVREYCSRAMLINDSQLKLIGKPADVAREYSLLFMENAKENVEDNKEKKGKRWGDGRVRMSSVKASLEKNDVVVQATATVKQAVDRIIYGLHILSQDGTEVTAMNNRMILTPDVEDVQSGSEIEFTWKMPNIFNDGQFSVTVTLIDDLSNTLDWITNAANFTVKRAERSTTPVLPPVQVIYKIKKGNL